MHLTRAGMAAALVSIGCVWGQTPGPIRFEVASVRRATPEEAQARRRATAADGRVEFRSVTLWYAISFAYGMKSYQMFGPEWLRQERYDIVAKGPEGTRREDLPKMMQALLEERFRLKVHEETREIPAMALTAKTERLNLKEAAAESGDGQGGAQVGMSASENGGERLDIKGGTMSTLANTLTGLLGRPVVDQTGLAGRYDFVLDFSRSETAGRNATGGYNEPPPLPPPPPGAEPGVSIYTSIQQLGLRLSPLRRPMPVLVIDSADKMPAEN